MWPPASGYQISSRISGRSGYPVHFGPILQSSTWTCWMLFVSNSSTGIAMNHSKLSSSTSIVMNFQQKSLIFFVRTHTHTHGQSLIYPRTQSNLDLPSKHKLPLQHLKNINFLNLPLLFSIEYPLLYSFKWMFCGKFFLLKSYLCSLTDCKYSKCDTFNERKLRSPQRRIRQ